MRMKNLSSDTHAHQSKFDQDLYDLISKEAEDTGDDEDKSTVSTAPDLYEEGGESDEGTLDASWGEAPQPDPAHNSDQVYKYHQEGREKMLAKLLDSKATSDKAQQGILAQHLEHARKGDFETSSPQLTEKSKMSSVPFATIKERLAHILK